MIDCWLLRKCNQSLKLPFTETCGSSLSLAAAVFVLYLAEDLKRNGVWDLIACTQGG